jgi:uncharacterized membrane protein SirB2
MTYLALKNLHVTLALLSICGFILRGHWMRSGSLRLRHRLTRTIPHAVDAMLLLSGAALIWQVKLNALAQPWLLAKFVGSIALRRGRTRPIRTTALLLAIGIFAYIAGVALTKSPTSWIALAN